ncbi:MAG: hypothetical protein AAF411_15770 [Myxococcota bacterium]
MRKGYFRALLLLSAGCVGSLESTAPDASAAADTAVDARPLDAVDERMEDAARNERIRDASADGFAPFDAGADAASPDLGLPDPCAEVECPRNAVCVSGTCECATGFEAIGEGCEPEPVGDPLDHSEAEACERWNGTRAASGDGFTVSDATCDPGELAPSAIDEGMARINFYRWLVGVGPAAPAPAHVQAQHCALVSAWNPAGPGAHFPPDTATCFTPEGAQGAASSNIAWGSRSTIHAIDQWVQDRGNATTIGHRRWILHPPLSNVQLGLYRGGTSFGGAACMGVFGSGSGSPRPEWFAFPPPGPSPVRLPTDTWTFHAAWSFRDVAITVTRLGDGEDMPIMIQPLNPSGGFGYVNATSFIPMGWRAEAGETYRVSIVEGERSVTYDVRPVDC